VEDKTFGLKNKNKSKKVQMYVKQVQKATAASFIDVKKKKEEDAKQAAKEAKRAHKKEQDALFHGVISQPKVPFGVDPKTIACAFFKAGQCTKKGNSCKFSHDQEICFGKKKAVGNKIDLTVDVEAMKAAGKKEEEEIAITDPEELQKAIEKKARQQACETHIVCKHFLNAIELKKYGWFWECPDNKGDGNNCKYRHALPPGYVFKDKKKSGDESDEEEEETIEQRIDRMRKGLGPGAMVTAETFGEWKRKRLEKKEAERLAHEKKLQKTYKKGARSQLTGRQLFQFDASIFVDDVDASGADTYQKEFEDAEMAETIKSGSEGLPLGGNATAPADEAAADPLDTAFEVHL